MKQLIYLLLTISSLSIAQTQKRALIIAVGDYPSRTGWSNISSVNDIPLIKDALMLQNFNETNIAVIQNEQATKHGILTSLKKLFNEANEGDIVVIHYSGHGQQIFDDNGDEVDGLDEALVPYDAFAKFTHNYKGEKHIRDDELEQIINNFRNKLGKDGQLLMIFDSCHSGSATRGGKARGGVSSLVPPGWQPGQKVQTDARQSEFFETVKLAENPASFVLISGASAEELNYEYQGVGSLSYAFSKALTNLGTNFSYRQLFANIATEMSVIAPRQNPAIEGDLDYKLFKGEYVAQQPYFTIKRIGQRSDGIIISGGSLQQIFKGTTVFVMPSGLTEATANKAVSRGEVIESRFNEAVIKLDKALTDRNERNYWVFIDQPTFGDMAVKVYIDASANQPEVVNSINKFLSDNKLGEIVSEQHVSDLTILKNKSDFELAVTNDILEIDKAVASRGNSALEDLNQKIFQYAQGKYLKSLNIKNPNFEFSFRLLPVAFDDVLNEVGEVLEPKLDDNQILRVRPEIDHVVLEVTNKSKQPIYFSIVEINTQGQISPFMPNNDCSLNNQERMVAAGQTAVFKRCVFSFGPPYEKLMLKGFASPSPLNFQSTVQTRGVGTRGNANPLEKFLSQTYNQSRGSGGNSVSDRIDAFSFELVYEIVR